MRSRASFDALLIAILVLPLIIVAGAAEGRADFAPPLERTDRFGVYNWNIDDRAFPGGALDRLNWGAEIVAQTGSRTIRVFLGARDIYGVNPPGADLAQIAASPAYDRLFRDARFKTYLLTVYSRGAMLNNWSDGFTPAEAGAEREEVRRLAAYLLANPALAGKTFLILNWEGDNAMAPVADKRQAWDDYRDWIRARAEGVKQARASGSGGGGHVFSGLEYNAVTKGGAPCGTPVSDPVNQDPLRHRCVIDYVAPQVEVDYYSFSAWESIAIKYIDPQADLVMRLKADLELALARVRTGRPEVTADDFLIGEAGFGRTAYGECAAANHLAELLAGFEEPGAFPVSWIIFWQIVDSKRNFGTHPDGGGFGLFKPLDGVLRETLAGAAFRHYLSGAATVVATGCPGLRQPPPQGVTDSLSRTPDFHLDPDSVLAIEAAPSMPFSASGNLVRFDQARREYILPRDNADYYSESISLLTAALPRARRPGYALVYVTGSEADGRRDSNAQLIRLDCAACPEISSECGILESTYQVAEFRPWQLVTIRGRAFSPSGNTVVFEQEDEQGATRRLPARRDDAWSESTTEITARLPTGLLPDRDAIVVVVDAAGRESNEGSLLPALEYAIEGPQLRPCRAILNGSSTEFHRGTVASIYGRFSERGNRVVVEQNDQFGVPTRYFIAGGTPGWIDSDRRIDVPLPIALRPGRALIYVIDAAGRETRAREIAIAPTTMTSLSAASFIGGSLARESIVAAFGNALAIETQSATVRPLPYLLAGTSITVRDSAGIERPAPLFFVSPHQINYQLPPGTITGAALVTVTSGDGSVTTEMIEVSDVAPGLFAASSDGRGAAAAFALRVRADGTRSEEPVAIFDPARETYVTLPLDLGPGTEQLHLVLFGTGLRFHAGEVRVTVGGLEAIVSYAGPQETFVGLDQINLQLPRQLAGRGEVEVSLSVAGKTANPVLIRLK